jgi:hypothetical protein
LGKAEILIDESMVEGRNLGAGTAATAAGDDGAETPRGEEVGRGEPTATTDMTTTATGKKAFEDVTDLKNEEFIYVY